MSRRGVTALNRTVPTVLPPPRNNLHPRTFRVASECQCILSSQETVYKVSSVKTNPYQYKKHHFSKVSSVESRSNHSDEGPLYHAKRLIRSTNLIMKEFIDTHKVGNAPQNDQRIHFLLKDWSKVLKQLEMMERNERPRRRPSHQPPKTNVSAVLMEATETVDRLARALFTISSSHQVFATETAITAWSRVRSHPSAATRAQELFDMLQFDFGRAISVRTPLIRLRRNLYNALLLAWSRSTDKKASEQTLAILDRMKNEGTENDIQLANAFSYNFTMTCLAKSGAPTSTKRVMELWKEMEASNIQPDAVTYDALISAYQNSGKDVHEAVQVFLKQLTQYGQSSKTKTAHPHTRPLSSTLKRILSMCQKNPKQARLILQRCLDLEQEFSECQGLVDTQCFMTVMLAHTRIGEAEQAEELLIKLLALDHIQADRRVYGVVLDAYSMRGTPDSVKKVETMLDAIERRLLEQNANEMDMDATIYNILMTSYLRAFSPTSVEKIRNTLERMKSVALRLNKPQLRPDHISYTILMKALMQEGRPSFAQEIEEVLRVMKSNVDLTGQIPYSVAMDAWIKSNQPDAIERIEALMTSIDQPDVFCYNTLLNAYAKRGRSDDALALLWKMQEDVKTGRNSICRPDNVTYSTVIHALHNSGQSSSWHQGLQVFSLMMDQFEAGDQQSKPSEKTVATQLQLLASSDLSSYGSLHYREAMKVWSRLETIGFQHGPYSVTAFIEACSETISDDPLVLREAFSHVGTAFAGLRDKATPLVYNAMLEACEKLVVDKDERLQFLSDLYKLCISKNQATPLVLNTLRRICDPELYQLLTAARR